LTNGTLLDNPDHPAGACQEEFGNNINNALKEAKPILTYNMLKRFLANSGSPDNEKFDKSSKDRLIFFYDKIKSPKKITYEYFSRLIGQTKIEFDNIARMDGTYKYCRPYLKESEAEQLQYFVGDISIFYEDDIPCFTHTSHNWSTDHAGPEHSGYIFLKKSHVFMLGFTKGVIRLAILDVEYSIDTRPVKGLVLSKRMEDVDNAFSAKFVMAHASNKNLLASFEEIHDKPEETQMKRSKKILNEINSTIQYLLLP
jgi:hypothetical protein